MKKSRSSHQVDEGFMGALIGDQNVAGIKSMFKKGVTKQDQLAQDIFMKDFMSDAVSALRMAIQGGFVDPGVSSRPQAAPDTRTAAQKVAGDTKATQPGGTPRPVGGAAPAATPGTKPAAPTSIRTSSTQMGAKPQQPLRPTSTNVKFNMPNAKPGAAAAPAPTAPAAAAPAAPRVNSAAQRMQAQRQAQKNQAKLKPKPSNPVKESDSTYARLSSLFESIMEETGGQSISEYMTNWFNKYMGGVDWQQNERYLKPLIQSVEDTYGNDKGYKALQKLANAAFAVAKVAGVTPQGAPQNSVPPKGGAEQPAAGGQAAGGQAPGGQAAGGQSGAAAPSGKTITAADINQLIPTMNLKQLQALKRTVDAFVDSKMKAKTPAAPAAAPAAAPTAAPKPAAPTATAESRYRR